MSKKCYRFSVYILLFILTFSSPAQAKVPSILAKNVKGETVIVRDGSPLAVTEDTTLQQGDVVQTEAGGSVDLIYPSRFGYRLQESSQCALKTHKKREIDVEMVLGEILFNVVNSPKKTKLRVSTTTSVAAVRGTQFGVRVLPTGQGNSTTYLVRRGKVEIDVENLDATLPVTKEQALEVAADGSWATLRKATNDEMEALTEADQIEVPILEEVDW